MNILHSTNAVEFVTRLIVAGLVLIGMAESFAVLV